MTPSSPTESGHWNESPNVPNDGDLLREFVLRNDQIAFQQLLDRHQRMVIGVCRSMLYDFADVEDAFQKVFAILARKAARLNRRHDIGGWLHLTAVNVSLKIRRQRQRNRERRLEYDPISNAQGVGTGLIKQQELALLNSEIGRLPKRYRDVIVLFYFEGKSRTQIADQLDRSVGSVKASLDRARRMLQKRLLAKGLGSLVVVAILGRVSDARGPLCLLENQDELSGISRTKVLSACAQTRITGCLPSIAPLPLPFSSGMVMCGICLAAFVLLGFTGFTNGASMNQDPIKELKTDSPNNRGSQTKESSSPKSVQRLATSESEERIMDDRTWIVESVNTDREFCDQVWKKALPTKEGYELFSRQPFGDYRVEIGRYSTGESGLRVVNQQQVLFLEELDVDNDRLPDVWKFYAKGRVNLRKWKRNQSVFIALVFEHYELFGELNGNNGQPGQFNLRVKSKDRYFDSESIRLNVGDEIIVTKLYNETIKESLGKISAEQTIYYEPFTVVIDTNKMTRQGLTKLFGDLNRDLLKMPEEKATSVQLAVIPDSTNRDSGPPKSGSSVQNVR